MDVAERHITGCHHAERASSYDCNRLHAGLRILVSIGLLARPWPRVCPAAARRHRPLPCRACTAADSDSTPRASAPTRLVIISRPPASPHVSACGGFGIPTSGGTALLALRVDQQPPHLPVPGVPVGPGLIVHHLRGVVPVVDVRGCRCRAGSASGRRCPRSSRDRSAACACTGWQSRPTARHGWCVAPGAGHVAEQPPPPGCLAGRRADFRNALAFSNTAGLTVR